MCSTVVLQKRSTAHVKEECLESQADVAYSKRRREDDLDIGTDTKQQIVPEYAVQKQSPEQDVSRYEAHTAAVVKTEPVDVTEASTETCPVLSGRMNDNLLQLYEEHEIKTDLVIGPTAVQDTASVTSTHSMNYCACVLHNGDNVNKSVHGETRVVLDKVYECDVCKETLLTCYVRLERHVAAHTQPAPHLSKDYREINTLGSQLNTSAVSQSCKQEHSCDLCKKKFVTRRYLTQHLHTHTDEKPYTCDVCKKSFRMRQIFRRHLLSHTDEKTHSCDVCKKYFTSKRSLKHHLLIHASENLYTCDVCKKSFKTNHYLKRHLHTHTGEKQYTCDMCKRSFRTAQLLKYHLFTHTGEKPYSCDVCKKYFTTKQSWKHHLLIHSRENLYSCDVCKKSFKTNLYLKRHLLTHTDEKQYTCGTCKKSFRTVRLLKCHMFIHTDEKPYRCDVCKKSFKTNLYLKRHLHTHTGEKHYNCDCF
ncbi:zinc finger protein 501-like [Achroia grisella]|uniref:zinc finger protein 501-like n=1 Tax=Achroia grisella TaxID=688607 RepID=UPI0027D1F6D9|nr:zinc finger protein 501-like [Achroia grisella]